MTRTTTRRSRNGARLPEDSGTPHYLGENIEKDLEEVSRRAGGGTMQSRILVAAIALFAERGYENLNMRTLASWVGLKAPTLYNYYPSKEALLVGAIDLGMDDFFSYILDGIEAVPRGSRLFTVIDRHARYKMRHRLIARANDRLIDPQFARMFLPDDAARHFSERMAGYRHQVQDLVRDYVPDDGPVSPKVVTLAVLSQCDRMAYWYNPHGEMSEDQALAQVTVLIRRMLGSPEACAG
ncbi:TetR/AcrR family transcriptional regulator [Alloalcanivorax sp. C16-2]|uniref:TetR/AcrR family transcriptional regulator n=1 Tax=Alloalcanivorax TaxID=3020832 RepID=UPI00193457AB|nr:TetR/AcrR family transcriptional regulator [Alloalcanivorax marinus]MBL7249450.1 TetR family transcriptional regulator [Alloalcanivorax marinus]